MAIAFALQDYRSGNSSWRKQVLGNTLSLYEAGRTTSGMYNEVRALGSLYRLNASLNSLRAELHSRHQVRQMVSSLRISTANTFGSFYGLAEATAYLAYNDSARLDVAKGNFDIVYNDFLNISDAQHDKHPRKFNTTCGRKSLIL